MDESKQDVFACESGEGVVDVMRPTLKVAGGEHEQSMPTPVPTSCAETASDPDSKGDFEGDRGDESKDDGAEFDGAVSGNEAENSDGPDDASSQCSIEGPGPPTKHHRYLSTTRRSNTSQLISCPERTAPASISQPFIVGLFTRSEYCISRTVGAALLGSLVTTR